MNTKLESQNSSSTGCLPGQDRFSAACLLLAALLLTATSTAMAQTNASYAIGWWTADGGGGNSSGAQYTLSGTIGQPDAGTLTGGNFTVIGGFWSLIAAVQTPGAPFLNAIVSNAAVVVSWPKPAEGWSLTCSPVLTGGTNNWTPIPPPYQTNATHYYVVEPNPAGNRFYRLQKP
jgi:hypothetical protein